MGGLPPTIQCNGGTVSYSEQYNLAGVGYIAAGGLLPPPPLIFFQFQEWSIAHFNYLDSSKQELQ
jgi:hypothetical protein